MLVPIKSLTCGSRFAPLPLRSLLLLSTFLATMAGGHYASADELIGRDLGAHRRTEADAYDPVRRPLYLQSAEDIRAGIRSIPLTDPADPNLSVAEAGPRRLERSNLRDELSRRLSSIPRSQAAEGEGAGLTAQDVSVQQFLSALDQADASVLAVIPDAVAAVYAPSSERKVRSPLLDARKRGFRLRRKPATTAGDPDPATLTYTRNWEPAEEDPSEVFGVEFGLTWDAGIRRLSNSRVDHALVAPMLWVGGDLQTGTPRDSNWYGAGVAASFVLADDKSLCEKADCCTRLLQVAAEADWTKSQDGDTEKFTFGATANPIYAPLCLGHRCSMGAVDWDWLFKPSVKLVHTTMVGDSRERGSTTGRAHFSVSARFWLRSLARALGLDSVENSPMIVLTYSGYALLDQGDYLDHFRGSFNVPLPNVTAFPHAFSLELAYERGTQAPVSFRREENLQIALGIRL